MLGAGPVADAFFVAFKLPNLFRRLFAEGAFNAAFVPLFAARTRRARAGARPGASPRRRWRVLLAVLLAFVLVGGRWPCPG